MGKIRLLPDDVASQVAAGEVVERPASVVKELVENSLDAGASRITVEFARGGAQLIRVTDDGSGMDREDALLSLQRHATSKIRTARDLAGVATMGFRGEAVPSIASVSRFRMRTCPREAAGGTEIVVAGGKVESVGDCGGPTGTSIEVAALFFNLPARRKFLRGEETEAAHVIHQVEALALANPPVAITLVRDGRRLWQAAATTDLGVRIRDLFGEDFLRKMLPLEPCEVEGIRVAGFLSKPGEGRPDRDQQFVMLNGRIVQCPAIFQPLRQAYAEVLSGGRHPLAVLNLEMDPLSFDCNVHPAKREVRFHRSDLVKQAVFFAAKGLLERLRAPSLGEVAKRGEELRSTTPTPTPAVLPPPKDRAFSPAPQPPLQISSPPPPPGETFELIGGLDSRWIILRSQEGLVLLHIRAASERILFERLRREMASGDVPVQPLLLPEVLDLPAKDAAWVLENLPSLRAAGFGVEPFGGGAFKIEAMPAVLSGRDAKASLLDLCEALRTTGTPGNVVSGTDSLARSVSSLAALDGFTYEEGRARQLVRELLRCELPYASPRGRPTMIQWSFSELERKFS